MVSHVEIEYSKSLTTQILIPYMLCNFIAPHPMRVQTIIVQITLPLYL